MRPNFQHYYFPFALALLAVAVWLGGDTITNTLQFDRQLLAEGQAWRVFTAHITHLSGSHLSLNIAGLALTFFLFGPLYSVYAWLSLYAFAAFAVTLGVFLWNPDIFWYVGLSGVLHSFFVAGGLANLLTHRIESTLFLLVIGGKVLWEQYAGPLPGSEETAGGPVLVDAHFYGAIAGLVWFLVYRWLKRGKT